MVAASNLRVCVFGAAGDTGNFGVSALSESIVDGIARRRPAAEVTVFDNGRGRRCGSLPAVGGQKEFRFHLMGARLSRRLHRPESLYQMLLAAHVGGRLNVGARAIGLSDAVLDISGGDSFTDLYGSRRWQMVTLPKRIALRMGRPLLLLPQTYGPYADAGVRRAAADIVRRATRAWARDERSLAALRDLLGADFDPDRHRGGVDVAFGLVPRRPPGVLPAPLDDWLAPTRAASVAGINISGLLYNDPAAVGAFGLRCDYRAVMTAIVRRLLAESDARVVLVPHVVVPDGGGESDLSAAQSVAAELGNTDRLAVAPVFRSPGEVKWLISRLDWLCGTRMHATIAALSTGVPASAVAYSAKVQGVFESCAVGDQVVDARSFDTADVVDAIWASWQERAQVRRRLAISLPDLMARVQAQMDEIVAACAGDATPAGVAPS